MAAIRAHVAALTLHAHRQLSALQHHNGVRVCELYGPVRSEGEPHGPVVAFNVRRASGDFVGYATVEHLAAQQRPPLQLRTGCLCNPGACQVCVGGGACVRVCVPSVAAIVVITMTMTIIARRRHCVSRAPRCGETTRLATSAGTSTISWTACRREWCVRRLAT
jgi:selenocysteine lyase/cysteine desulfurase